MQLLIGSSRQYSFIIPKISEWLRIIQNLFCQWSINITRPNDSIFVFNSSPLRTTNLEEKKRAMWPSKTVSWNQPSLESSFSKVLVIMMGSWLAHEQTRSWDSQEVRERLITTLKNLKLLSLTTNFITENNPLKYITLNKSIFT